MNPNVLQNKTNIKIFREKTFSFELDLNQRLKDSCLTPHYSPPLYQLSYRRVIYTTVDGNTLVGFLTTGLHCGIFNYICNKRQYNKATNYQSFCELLKYNTVNVNCLPLRWRLDTKCTGNVTSFLYPKSIL